MFYKMKVTTTSLHLKNITTKNTIPAKNEHSLKKKKEHLKVTNQEMELIKS